jgi:small subunit ribosomal protein S4
MKIGPKYKIARRLGAPIFEKTQGPKYTLSLSRKERAGTIGRGRPKSEYGAQLIEKQKTRFTYGLSEKQFRNYVIKSAKSSFPTQKLFTLLETRLDNVIYRAGLCKTRLQARQMASHGHFLVNGKRVTIPSISLTKGDIVSVRPGSSGSVLFFEVSEKMKAITIPEWLEADLKKIEIKVVGEPKYVQSENLFDLGAVIEFYSR